MSQHERDIERLLEFLRDRDVPCPVCRYDLRDLRSPQCPECRQPLVLTVGVAAPRLLLFLILLSPSIFSGIGAVLLLALMIIVPATGGGPPPGQVVALDVIGFASGVIGLVLVHRRYRFLALPRAVQLLLASATWVLHVAVAAWLLAWAIYF